MREPQDVRLDLPDGAVIRPSETRHSATDTGQRWDYRFDLTGTPFDPLVQQRMAEGMAENWQRAQQTMRDMSQAMLDWRPGCSETGGNSSSS